MAAGLGEKIEKLPWTRDKSRRWVKKQKLRRERRLAKVDPERLPEYRKYSGFEY